MTHYLHEFRKKVFLPLVLATAISPACNFSDKTSPVRGGDWVPLFDGKTFKNWHTYGMESIGNAWKVEDRAMHLSVLAKKGWQTMNGGDLVSDEKYDNFDLKLEWKIAKAGNSGIFFYVHEDPKKFKNPNLSGLEMQVNDDENNKNGLIEMQRNGDLVGLVSSSSEKVVKPAGQWNQVEIRSVRGKLDFFLNGQHVLSTSLWDDDWEDLIDQSRFKTTPGYGTYKKGRIALQDHGADVWFRNIMIKEL